MTKLSPTGYVDGFARDHLPPTEDWPTLEFTTPLLQYPDRLNAATDLIERSSTDNPNCNPSGVLNFLKHPANCCVEKNRIRIRLHWS